MLPLTAACVICGLDGWGQQIVVPITKMSKHTPSSLMECSVCYEIIHPDCIAKQVRKFSKNSELHVSLKTSVTMDFVSDTRCGGSCE